MTEKLYTHSFTSPLGEIHTASVKEGIALITLPGESKKSFAKIIATRFPENEIVVGGAENKKAEKQINSFLNGKLRDFSIKLVITGTSFQKKILQKTAGIPYGKTLTYGTLAKKAGYPNAARAVGAVMATNPFPLVIPCHRVVGRTGLQGYGGGLKMKRDLLTMEGADF